jgi:hypothetical protein
MKIIFIVLICLFFFLIKAEASYIPFTVSNGSTSFQMIKNLFFNGGVSISNPSFGRANVEIASGTSNIFNGSFADNALIRGDTSSTTIQASGVLLDDLNNLTNVNSMHLNGTSSISEVLRVNGAVLMNGLVKSNPEFANGNCGAAKTINWNNGNNQSITLNNASCTLSFIAPSGVVTGNFLLKVVQDASGNRTVIWPGTIRWANSTGISLSTAANAIDMVSCYYDGANYFCTAVFRFG